MGKSEGIGKQTEQMQCAYVPLLGREDFASWVGSIDWSLRESCCLPLTGKKEMKIDCIFDSTTHLRAERFSVDGD